jgi:hypothetical protein
MAMEKAMAMDSGEQSPAATRASRCAFERVAQH